MLDQTTYTYTYPLPTYTHSYKCSEESEREGGEEKSSVFVKIAKELKTREEYVVLALEKKSDIIAYPICNVQKRNEINVL